MKFTIWLTGGNIPLKYRECITSQEWYTPDLVVVRNWGNCPLPRHPDDRFASDTLRMWILSQIDRAEYRDADLMQFAEIPDCPAGEVVAGHWYGNVDIWFIQHNGRKDYFANMLREVQGPQVTGRDYVRWMQAHPVTLSPDHNKFMHQNFTGMTQGAELGLQRTPAGRSPGIIPASPRGLDLTIDTIAIAVSGGNASVTPGSTDAHE